MFASRRIGVSLAKMANIKKPTELVITRTMRPHGNVMLRCSSTAQMFDDASPAVMKMQSILDDYREKNFGQTLFSRFVKEILASTDADGDGKISSKELQAFLINIGAENCLSKNDIEGIMAEYGESDGSQYFMYVHDVESLILQ